MDAVTYPNAEVIAFLNENFIPLRVAHDAKPLSEQFHVKWTPLLVTLDPLGGEHHRTVGFLAPAELIQSLLLGLGKRWFDGDRFAEALDCFDRLLAGYPEGDGAAEAMYLQGVSRYKQSHDPQALKETHERLEEKHPGSEWTKRAFPYRLL
ncbi:MAG: hypothetical protein AB1568_08635 [Thermodesulfobacteriota bacterium]